MSKVFYPIWEAATLDEWLYNGGPYQLIVCHFFLGVCCYMGREWELSFRLGMRPWIAVAYSAPVAAATAVFIIYPIGQGSFSDGMPLGKLFAPFLLILVAYLDIYDLNMFRKEKLETRLNGKYPFYFILSFLFNLSQMLAIAFQKVNVSKRLTSIYALYGSSYSSSYDEDEVDLKKYSQEDQNKSKDDSVSNRLQPRTQPGIYIIRCIANDKRYYGESSNVSARLSSHKSMLNRNIHPNAILQRDWNLYKQENFEFYALYMGPKWENREERLAKEAVLILYDREICYNYLVGNARPKEQNPFWGKTHTAEAKVLIGKANAKPNNLLGKPIKMDGQIYPSITEASRQTNKARKTIRKRLQDPNDTNCIEIKDND
jgi:Photosynthetic reaction centre protein/GIY-YIG catalytic domain